jgi:hypothetical protein
VILEDSERWDVSLGDEGGTEGDSGASVGLRGSWKLLDLEEGEKKREILGEEGGDEGGEVLEEESELESRLILLGSGCLVGTEGSVSPGTSVFFGDLCLDGFIMGGLLARMKFDMVWDLERCFVAGDGGGVVGVGAVRVLGSSIICGNRPEGGGVGERESGDGGMTTSPVFE